MPIKKYKLDEELSVMAFMLSEDKAHKEQIKVKMSLIDNLAEQMALAIKDYNFNRSKTRINKIRQLKTSDINKIYAEEWEVLINWRNKLVEQHKEVLKLKAVVFVSDYQNRPKTKSNGHN